MSNWRYVDPFSEDDPAVVRMREGLALRSTEPPGKPDGSGDAPATDAGDSGEPAGATRRERIQELVRRIENGERGRDKHPPPAAIREVTLCDKAATWLGELSSARLRPVRTSFEDAHGTLG